MKQHLESRPVGDLLRQVRQSMKIRVQDFLAPSTDNVRVGIGFRAVVTIAPVRKTQFEHLVQLFKQRYGLVDGSQARGGEPGFDALINLFDAGMPFPGCQDLNYRKPLGRDPKPTLLQFVQHFQYTLLSFGHEIRMSIRLRFQTPGSGLGNSVSYNTWYLFDVKPPELQKRKLHLNQLSEGGQRDFCSGYNGCPSVLRREKKAEWSTLEPVGKQDCGRLVRNDRMQIHRWRTTSRVFGDRLIAREGSLLELSKARGLLESEQ